MISAALHLTLAALAYCLLSGDLSPLGVAFALLLGLTPDLDTPKSLVGSLARSISVPLERRVGHRTATHSLLALGFVAGVAYLLAPAQWLGLAGAYGSHLLLDLLIGVQGIRLGWPAGEYLTLTAWRDDGPAPRVLLCLALPALLVVASWGQLAPLLTPAVSAAVAVANPIATPHPSPTLRPSVQLRFALPPGVGLSALRVRRGDTVREGQLLAAWDAAVPSPWPTPTPPTGPATPAPLDMPAQSQAAAWEAREAEAALQALLTTQGAERAALIDAQAREGAELLRLRDAAQRAIDALQPEHERDQAERQHAVDAARIELADAQAAQALAGRDDAQAAQRAAERVHAAEAELRAAIDAQDRMRARHGAERMAAEAALREAQADLDALPELQRQALARLDGDHAAGRITAAARVARARGLAGDEHAASEAEQRHVEATATALARAWQHEATATAEGYALASAATAQAWPTPTPSRVISHAAGQVAEISAEERDGQLTITIELIPTL